ncbi:MAG: epoxide hydrolase [Solirubrobacteraceae bacterium]|jgi:pimeloyl-ACP methyl ester carboxylesterase|nr:epoxide hydrolase [Solirubrobacteraceae bacterium]
MQDFRIAVPDSALADLRARLQRTRWPADPAGLGWDRGAPLAHVQALAQRWADGYDWRAWEARLNAWPQALTSVDGATIHLAHVRSPEPDALPLVLSHGWPGSIAEFLDVAGPLADPRAHGGDPADAFHLVMPSLPGFAWSGPAATTGWDPRKIAGAFAALMERLGYDRYGVQGGDWGSAISRWIGADHPERVVGVHVNMLSGALPRTPDGLDDDERARWQHAQTFLGEGRGYYALQSTKPQTLSYALTDSPAGQLAWIAEKYEDWTDTPVGPDEVLTQASTYWFTGTAGSSAQIYLEHVRAGGRGAHIQVEVPVGVAVFPKDLTPPIRRFAEGLNIVRWTEMPRGGHFAAMEEPELLVDDVRAFFRPLR